MAGVERRPSETDLRSSPSTPQALIVLPRYPARQPELTALVEHWPDSQVDQLIEFLEGATTVIHESAEQLSSAGGRNS